MRHLIDLSKLPAPQLIEELDYEAILNEMRKKLRELLPEWTGYELESDPANKVLEVAAYREMLLRQRVNEAARGVLIAFAQGSDLDHLAAFYPEKRLEGASAVFPVRIMLTQEMGVEVTVPKGFTVVAKSGAVEARLMNDVIFLPGNIAMSGIFEVVRPSGLQGNGLRLVWDPITPLPFVAGIRQEEVSSGGSDPESDEAFRNRARESLHQHSTAGAYGAYRYHAQSADVRIRDTEAWSPERGHVSVAVLSSEGDGSADSIMLRRVEERLSGEDVRPGTDLVTVVSAEIVPYEIQAVLELYPGVAGSPPLEEAKKRLERKVEELHRLGCDVPRSALIAAAHVSGIKKVEMIKPEADIPIERHQAAYCTRIEVGSRVADEP